MKTKENCDAILKKYPSVTLTRILKQWGGMIVQRHPAKSEVGYVNLHIRDN